jgi:hypothetical protein
MTTPHLSRTQVKESIVTEPYTSHSPLSSGEIELLSQTRALKPGLPPAPWKDRTIISASGVLAGGWDISENILLISTDGYSVSNPKTGEVMVRNRDYARTFASILPGYLQFKIPDTEEEIIDIFGINAGDGIHRTEDGWILRKVYPWWPQEAVLIKSPFVPDSGRHNLLDDAYIVSLERLTGWLRCGFSSSGKYFAIIGSAGAEIFSR